MVTEKDAEESRMKSNVSMPVGEALEFWTGSGMSPKMISLKFGGTPRFSKQL